MFCIHDAVHFGGNWYLKQESTDGLDMMLSKTELCQPVRMCFCVCEIDTGSECVSECVCK